MRRTLVAVGLVVLVAAACSGGDDDAGPDDSTAEPSPLPRGENTELLLPVLDRLNAAREATYKVVYDFSGQPAEGIPQGTLTIAQRPPQQRTEVTGGDDGVAIAFIGDDAGTIACASQAGPAAYQCFETSAFIDTSPAAISASDLIDIADDLRKAQGNYSFSESTQEIAGTSALCITAQATDAISDVVRERVGETVEVCTTESGVPLVIETQGGSDPISVRATSITTDVTDADFQPPAPVQAGPPNFQVPVPPETVPQGE